MKVYECDLFFTFLFGMHRYIGSRSVSTNMHVVDWHWPIGRFADAGDRYESAVCKPLSMAAVPELWCMECCHSKCSAADTAVGRGLINYALDCCLQLSPVDGSLEFTSCVLLKNGRHPHCLESFFFMFI